MDNSDLVAWANEELHDDLKPWVSEGALGPMLRHPLVYSVPLLLPGHCNLIYEQKTKQVQDAFNEGRWSTFLMLHERPWRMTLLGQIRDDLDLETFRELLRDCWIDTESPHQFGKQRMINLFKYAGFITDSEAPKPPEDITVYRGGMDWTGLSWTGEASKAEWFSKRFGKEDPQWRAVVPPHGVLAIFLGRGESEVVVNWRTLKEVTQRPR